VAAPHDSAVIKGDHRQQKLVQKCCNLYPKLSSRQQPVITASLLYLAERSSNGKQRVVLQLY